MSEILKVFHSGKNGITGLCTLPGEGVERPAVFKTSECITNLIEHEYDIMTALEPLGLPQFCRLRAPKKIIRKCSDDMIYSIMDFEGLDEKELEEVNWNFSHDVKTGIPRTIIFEEFAGKLSLDDLITHEAFDVSMASIYNTLLALEIAQKKKRFTHNDLHPCNIFMKEIDYNTVFLFEIPGDSGKRNFLIPSYGYLPVIIDFGFSMIKDCEGKPAKHTTEHYSFGYQYTFDPLEDVTHLVIFAFYYLRKYPRFQSMFIELLKLFKSIPLATNGWRHLPNDLTKQVLDRLERNPSARSFDLFRNHTKEFLECLNYLVDNPFKDYGKSFFDRKKTSGWFEEFSKIDSILRGEKIPRNVLTNYRLFCLDLMVKVYRKIGTRERGEVRRTDGEVRRTSGAAGTEEEFIDKFQSMIESELVNFLAGSGEKARIRIKKELSEKKINYFKFWEGFREISETISSIYAVNYRENIETIKDCYSEVKISSPLDMFIWMIQRYPVYFPIDSKTEVIYLHDAKQDRLSCKGIPEKKIFEINKAPALRKGEMLAKLLRTG